MLIDISSTEIKTDRLLLRYWRAADLDDLFAFASVPGVEEMSGMPHHKSLEDSKKFLDASMNSKSCFAIYHLADKKVVGYLEMHGSWAGVDESFSHLNIVQIGFVLDKQYWGQGLAAEAALAVIKHSFSVWGFDAVSACHFVENTQSRRVLEKCGFVLKGGGKFYSPFLDKEFNEQRYILLKESCP